MSESFDNFDQAAEALAGAYSDSFSESTPEATPVEPESQPSTPVQDDSGTTGDVEFLDSKNIDLSQLDPTSRDFLQAREREMQAAFTRKTQELAALRQEAEQATQFIQELNSNPDFALEVHSRLSSELERLGYSPQAASAEAASQLEQQGYGIEEDDPYLAEINELKAWRSEQENRIRQAEVESRIDRETAIIQAQNPTWNDDDLGAVYGLALSFGGNLSAAADAYKDLNQRAIERYINQKDSVNHSAPATPSNSGSFSEAPPESLGDLGSKDLRQAAIARLRAEGYE